MNEKAMNRRSQRGLSLVELMVSIVIGLIILAGVIQVVLTSRASFFGQEEMSFIQENARYAVSVLGKDIQNAGHWGCAGPNAHSAMVGAVPDNALAFMATRAVDGFEGAPTGTASAASLAIPTAFSGKIKGGKDASDNDIKPDSILLRGLQGRAIPVKSHVDGTVTLDNAHSFNAGDYVAVIGGDCTRFGVFQISGTNANAVSYAADNNMATAVLPAFNQSVQCLSLADGVFTRRATCQGLPASPQLYDNTAEVMPYQARAFYIGTSSALGENVPALKRAVLRNGAVIEEEIALGVENMQFLYGQANGSSISYLTADQVTDWAAVVAVQVDLLFRSQTPVLPTPQAQPDLLGNSFNDRFARQVVSSTFRLRNRSLL